MTVQTDAHPFAIESAQEFGRSLATHLGESDAAARWLEKFYENEAVSAFPELGAECEFSYSSTLDSLRQNPLAQAMYEAFAVDEQTTASQAALTQSQQESWDTLLARRKISPEEYYQQINLLLSMTPSHSQNITHRALKSSSVKPYKRLHQDIRLAGILNVVATHRASAKCFLDKLSTNDDVSPSRALFYGYRLKQHGSNISDEHFKTFKAHQRKRMDAIKNFAASINPCQMKSIIPGLAPTYEKIQIRQKRLEDNVLAYTHLYNKRIKKKNPTKEDIYGYAYCSMECYVQGQLSLAQAQRNVACAAKLQNGQFELDARTGAAESIMKHALFPSLQKQTFLDHARALFKASPDSISSDNLIDSLTEAFFSGNLSSGLYMREVDATAAASPSPKDAYKRAGSHLRAKGCDGLVKRIDLIQKSSEINQTLNTPGLKLDAHAKREVAAYVTDVAHAEAQGYLEPWESRAFLKGTLGKNKRSARSVLSVITQAGFPGVPALNANAVRNSYRVALSRLNSSASLGDFVKNHYGPSTLNEHLNALIVDINRTCESVSVG